ncbi:MAG: hypothetical protein ACXVBJ_14815, partial [Flavisolibacter sp.]
MKLIFVLVILFTFISTCTAQEKKELRVSQGLNNILKGRKDKELIDVVVGIKHPSLIYKSDSILVINAYPPTNTFRMRLNVRTLNELINQGEIIFGDIYRAPKEELTTGTLDLSLNRINLVHNKFPFINGDSIFASIKEQ